MSSTRCVRESTRLSRVQTPEDKSLKSSLRHLGRKNYSEVDDSSNDSDFCTKKEIGPIKPNGKMSERKLSLRKRDHLQKTILLKNNVPSKNNNDIEIIDLCKSKSLRNSIGKLSSSKSPKKSRRKSTPESNSCCRRSDIKIQYIDHCDVLNSVNSHASKKEHKSSLKLRIEESKERQTDEESERESSKDDKRDSEQQQQEHGFSSATSNSSFQLMSSISKPKIIDNISQSEELSIECSTSTHCNMPKKSTHEMLLKRKPSNHIHSEPHNIDNAKKRKTLSQKHTEDNQQRFSNNLHHPGPGINRNGPNGKLCKKIKKTTIYHDSNGWIFHKGYYSSDHDFWKLADLDEHGSSKQEKTQQEIEVPSFREKKYACLYRIEGTEDLSDHVFEKRHSSFEADEKKMKKNFEIQTKYQLMRSKYYKNNELSYRKDSFLVKKFPKLIDLNQDVMNIKAIEIAAEIPVMVFGVPVKKMETVEFNLNELTTDEHH